MRWGSCTCKGDLSVCLNEGSNARKQWRWMTLSSCLTDVWLSTPPSLFPFHQRPLITSSTEQPESVPTGALLNDHRNTSTVSTFGNDIMEVILAWEKDWWGSPRSSCTNLHWPLNYQAAVPLFPRTSFFPAKKRLSIEAVKIKMPLLITTYKTWRVIVFCSLYILKNSESSWSKTHLMQPLCFLVVWEEVITASFRVYWVQGWNMQSCGLSQKSSYVRSVL